jgi:hypothetical protein
MKKYLRYTFYCICSCNMNCNTVENSFSIKNMIALFFARLPVVSWTYAITAETRIKPNKTDYSIIREGSALRWKEMINKLGLCLDFGISFFDYCYI